MHKSTHTAVPTRHFPNNTSKSSTPFTNGAFLAFFTLGVFGAGMRCAEPDASRTFNWHFVVLTLEFPGNRCVWGSRGQDLNKVGGQGKTQD